MRPSVECKSSIRMRSSSAASGWRGKQTWVFVSRLGGGRGMARVGRGHQGAHASAEAWRAHSPSGRMQTTSSHTRTIERGFRLDGQLTGGSCCESSSRSPSRAEKRRTVNVSSPAPAAGSLRMRRACNVRARHGHELTRPTRLATRGLHECPAWTHCVDALRGCTAWIYTLHGRTAWTLCMDALHGRTAWTHCMDARARRRTCGGLEPAVEGLLPAGKRLHHELQGGDHVLMQREELRRVGRERARWPRSLVEPRGQATGPRVDRGEEDGRAPQEARHGRGDAL